MKYLKLFESVDKYSVGDYVLLKENTIRMYEKYDLYKYAKIEEIREGFQGSKIVDLEAN
jgi:hypothetical protein